MDIANTWAFNLDHIINNLEFGPNGRRLFIGIWLMTPKEEVRMMKDFTSSGKLFIIDLGQENPQLKGPISFIGPIWSTAYNEKTNLLAAA